MSRTAARLLKVPACIALALALGVPLVCTQFVLAAAPDPDFTAAPEVPLPGQRATFTATGLKPADSVSWDFDNDGTFDATGRTGGHVFTTPGQKTVLMRVTGPDGGVRSDVRKPVRVDTPPRPSFTASPNPATVGEPVQFNATASSDPDGTIVSYEWDLDGNGSFETSSGSSPTTSHTYADAGTVNVRLRVTDNDGATAQRTVAVVVDNRRPAFTNQPPVTVLVVQRPVFVVSSQPVSTQPQLMSPFPIVRLVAKLTSKGAKVRLLLVSGAPKGATVTVRCRGRGCPLRERTRSMISSAVRFRPLEKQLRAGVSLQILITQPGKIGKYTSFKIRRSRAPLRQDLCVRSTSAKPEACPSS